MDGRGNDIISERQILVFFPAPFLSCPFHAGSERGWKYQVGCRIGGVFSLFVFGFSAWSLGICEN